MIATIGLTGYRAFSSSGTTTTIKASEQQFGREKMWACFSGMLATCKEGDVWCWWNARKSCWLCCCGFLLRAFDTGRTEPNWRRAGKAVRWLPWKPRPPSPVVPICAALSYSQLIQSGLRVASLRIIMFVSSCEVCYVQINNVQLFITVDTKHYRGETEIVYDTLLHRIKTKKVIYLKPNI